MAYLMKCGGVLAGAPLHRDCMVSSLCDGATWWNAGLMVLWPSGSTFVFGGQELAPFEGDEGMTWEIVGGEVDGVPLSMNIESMTEFLSSIGSLTSGANTVNGATANPKNAVLTVAIDGVNVFLGTGGPIIVFAPIGLEAIASVDFDVYSKADDSLVGVEEGVPMQASPNDAYGIATFVSDDYVFALFDPSVHYVKIRPDSAAELAPMLDWLSVAGVIVQQGAIEGP